MISPGHLTVAPLALFLTLACAAVAPVVPHIRLAWFSIGDRGDHSFNIPPGFVVDRVELKTQRTSTPDRGNPPFETSVVDLVLVDDGGRRVSSGAVRPMGWRFDREGEYRFVLPANHPTRHSATQPMTLRVTVTEPSVRRWDKARIVLRHTG